MFIAGIVQLDKLANGFISALLKNAEEHFVLDLSESQNLLHFWRMTDNERSSRTCHIKGRFHMSAQERLWSSPRRHQTYGLCRPNDNPNRSERGFVCPELYSINICVKPEKASVRISSLLRSIFFSRFKSRSTTGHYFRQDHMKWLHCIWHSPFWCMQLAVFCHDQSWLKYWHFTDVIKTSKALESEYLHSFLSSCQDALRTSGGIRYLLEERFAPLICSDWQILVNLQIVVATLVWQVRGAVDQVISVRPTETSWLTVAYAVRTGAKCHLYCTQHPRSLHWFIKNESMKLGNGRHRPK